jgi:hypothetical protein
LRKEKAPIRERGTATRPAASILTRCSSATGWADRSRRRSRRRQLRHGKPASPRGLMGQVRKFRCLLGQARRVRRVRDQPAARAPASTPAPSRHKQVATGIATPLRCSGLRVTALIYTLCRLVTRGRKARKNGPWVSPTRPANVSRAAAFTGINFLLT